MFHTEKQQPLAEVSAEELMEYRLSANPGLLIKVHGKLFLSRFNNLSLEENEFHYFNLCDSCSKVCEVCPKVRSLTLFHQLGLGRKFPDAVEHYGRPEKFNFITHALESFSRAKSEVWVVECKNYCKRDPNFVDEAQYFAETI